MLNRYMPEILSREVQEYINQYEKKTDLNYTIKDEIIFKEAKKGKFIRLDDLQKEINDVIEFIIESSFENSISEIRVVQLAIVIKKLKQIVGE